jgi:predicted O-methyltransferase YrrM
VIITGTPKSITDSILREHPELGKIMWKTKLRVKFQRRAVYEYQAAALYVLARQFNRPDCNLLEIGTAYGFSCSYIASAAPKANSIITLNPKQNELPSARQGLSHYPNVKVIEALSWDYLANYAGPELDMIFADGDHKQIARDMPWWNHLVTGGLMVFHDYAPAGTPRPCPPVYDCLNAWAAKLGRPMDVLVKDNGGVGLAGFYRRAGEVWK